MKTATCEIRWMIRSDYKAVAAFDGAPPLCRLSRLLRLKNVVGKVAECDGVIIGYSVYELHVGWRKLIALAVAPEHQRQGLGSRLLRNAARIASDGAIIGMSTIVRESNLPMQLFLRANGF